MPKLCEYRNCHNLGDSWLNGYCNQDHYERGMELELKEALEKIKKEKAEKAKANVDKKKVTTSSADAVQGNHTSCGGASQSFE
jgi:hypothetical protein